MATTGGPTRDVPAPVPDVKCDGLWQPSHIHSGFSPPGQWCWWRTVATQSTTPRTSLMFPTLNQGCWCAWEDQLTQTKPVSSSNLLFWCLYVPVGDLFIQVLFPDGCFKQTRRGRGGENDCTTLAWIFLSNLLLYLYLCTLCHIGIIVYVLHSFLWIKQFDLDLTQHTMS